MALAHQANNMNENKILGVFLYGICASIIFACLLASWFFYLTPDDPGYARRWDGTCGGWNQGVCMEFVISESIIYVSYIMIGTAIWAFYPLKERYRYNHLAGLAVSLIFISCGGTHLLNAYSIFHPAYDHMAIFNIITACISAVGACLAVYDLAYIRSILQSEQNIIDILRQ